MGFEQYKGHYDRDGFVVVRQLLTPAEFDDLRRNLDRYIREVVPTLPDSDAFYIDKSRPETLKQLQHMGCDSYFAAYARQPQSRHDEFAPRVLAQERRAVQRPRRRHGVLRPVLDVRQRLLAGRNRRHRPDVSHDAVRRQQPVQA